MVDERKFPLKRPKGHKVEVPRWQLRFPEGVKHIYTIYIGVQSREGKKSVATKAEQSIQDWLDDDEGCPTVVDTFRVTEGFDLAGSRVWVAYWTDVDSFTSKLRQLDLIKMWNDLGDEKRSIGLWCEHFSTPIDRVETNYARLEHKPGLARLPGTEQPSHSLTAYWGAGRDRLPASAHDRFEAPEDIVAPTEESRGIGEHLTGTNYDNMCHIRSGQHWVTCGEEERDAYEDGLQETLMKGMRYLWEHPEETGTIGLRFLQNLDEDGTPILETCGAGFHRNWADLEKWSSRHPSHLAIFNGATKHAKTFGDNRKFMTWHEVSILKAGEVKFEYVNCDPKTGVVRWVPLRVEQLTM